MSKKKKKENLADVKVYCIPIGGKDVYMTKEFYDKWKSDVGRFEKDSNKKFIKQQTHR